MSVRDIMMAASGATAGPTYIEDVFSTYLYTGNGSTQTINNGINLAGKGGMVWIKDRVTAGTDNGLFDTSRGVLKSLFSNSTQAQLTAPSGSDLTAFNSNGFSLGTDYNVSCNTNGKNIVSWTFRKAPKFFDVVTFTTPATSNTNFRVPHNLDSTPGMIFVKTTATVQDWFVWNRTFANQTNDVLKLNATNATITGLTNFWGTSAPTSTDFGVNTSWLSVNTTYVAYLFAHDTTTDGLIQCGSYTGNGSTSGPTVTLGWEPQYLLVKRTDTSGYSWFVFDQMRGLSYTNANYLIPDSSSAESAWGSALFNVTATGFNVVSNIPSFNANGGTYIYMAIRRGPMRTPTDGTKVFSIPSTYAGNSSTNTISTGNNAIDMFWSRPNGNWYTLLFDRLRGTPFLALGRTDYENQFGASPLTSYNENTITANSNTGSGGLNFIGESAYHNYYFNRAPGFFDVVCYTGTGVARTVNHNLGVAPELMIVKGRSNAYSWSVYSQPTGNTKYLWLEATDAATVNSSYWNNTSPTSSVFTVGATVRTNESSQTYVAYLFASCPGVSKVGSYTGNGSSQTINCGFTGGARFVMIKRTDASGNWYYWDTTTGITTGNEQYFIENTSYNDPTNNVIQTANDTIDPDASGFIVNQVTATSVNINAATYIYLAIA